MMLLRRAKLDVQAVSQANKRLHSKKLLIKLCNITYAIHFKHLFIIYHTPISLKIYLELIKRVYVEKSNDS